MRILYSILFFLSLIQITQATPMEYRAEIVRDSFGVPHIFGQTDADAAYGLAWAHSEDDFYNIQLNLLAAKGRLGEVLGKEGVLFDYALKLFSVDTLVDKRYETDLSSEFRKIADAYIQGVNDYARQHPGEVLLADALPFVSKDVIKGYVLSTSLMAGLGMTLKAIREDKIEEFMAPNDRGSNAIAIAPSRTEDGKAWLAVNSHQPIEGRFAWYEAHVASNDGWDMIGGLFPGGMSVFVGANRYLGWAHTNNFHTFGDVFELQVKKHQYLLDGKWTRFHERKIKLKIKLGGIKLSVGRTIQETVFGPVFKSKGKHYALRFPGYMDIRSAEQWFRMNKAKNYKEFEEVIRMEALPLFNIVYADVEGNILMHSGCKIPYRNEALDWTLPIKSNSSQYLWNELIPFGCKPTVLNPDCGFVYNANQTPLLATSDECNWNGDFVGLQLFQFNRGERLAYLMNDFKGKFTWEDFYRIKFDKRYHPNGCYREKFAALYQLDEKKYPKLSPSIQLLKNWDLDGNVHSKGATLAMLVHDHLIKNTKTPFAFLMIRKKVMGEQELSEALMHAQKFLLKTHGKIEVELGEVQRHIRGNVSIPASGLREVLRACDAKLYDKKKGIYRVHSGDGYIQMTRFGKNGVEINSISAYGASSHPESKHFNDQMEMFEREQFKPMTFDKATIYRNAERIYKAGKP